MLVALVVLMLETVMIVVIMMILVDLWTCGPYGCDNSCDVCSDIPLLMLLVSVSVAVLLFVGLLV